MITPCNYTKQCGLLREYGAIICPVRYDELAQNDRFPYENDNF